MLGLGTALSLAEALGFEPDPGTPGSEKGAKGSGITITDGKIDWGDEDWSPGDGGDAAEDIWVPGVDYDVAPGVEKKEEPGAPAVTLTAPPGSLQAGQWFNPLARQEYTAPAAQDWSGWMFGSPFGEQGGLLYQPWSAEYGQQYVPSNIWNWNPMEMSKATAFAPPIASTSILGDSASVANTTANNNNNTVVNTPIVNDGNQGESVWDGNYIDEFGYERVTPGTGYGPDGSYAFTPGRGTEGMPTAFDQNMADQHAANVAAQAAADSAAKGFPDADVWGDPSESVSGGSFNPGRGSSSGQSGHGWGEGWL